MTEKTKRIAAEQKIEAGQKRKRASHRAPSYEKRLEKRRLTRIAKAMQKNPADGRES